MQWKKKPGGLTLMSGRKVLGWVLMTVNGKYLWKIPSGGIGEGYCCEASAKDGLIKALGS